MQSFSPGGVMPSFSPGGVTPGFSPPYYARRQPVAVSGPAQAGYGCYSAQLQFASPTPPCWVNHAPTLCANFSPRRPPCSMYGDAPTLDYYSLWGANVVTEPTAVAFASRSSGRRHASLHATGDTVLPVGACNHLVNICCITLIAVDVINWRFSEITVRLSKHLHDNLGSYQSWSDTHSCVVHGGFSLSPIDQYGSYVVALTFSRRSKRSDWRFCACAIYVKSSICSEKTKYLWYKYYVLFVSFQQSYLSQINTRQTSFEVHFDSMHKSRDCSAP